MRVTPWVAPMMCAIGSCLVGVVHAVAPPVEAFAQRPAMVAIDINPSGTRLAWIEGTEQGSRVVIHDLAAHRDLRSIPAPASLTLSSVSWANDETILVRESKTQRLPFSDGITVEWYRWLAIDASGGEGRVLLPNDRGHRWLSRRVSRTELVRARTAKPGKVFMWKLDFDEARYRHEAGSRLEAGRKDSGWTSNLYEVDLRSGNGTILAVGARYTEDWIADESGAHIARTEFNAGLDQFLVLVNDGGSWRRVYKAKKCGSLTLLAFSVDLTAVIARGAACEEAREKLLALPLDGSAAQVLVEDPTLDVVAVDLDPLDGAVTSVKFSGGDSTRWLDPAAERRAAGFRTTFPNLNAKLIARSTNARRMVVRVEGASQPAIYYLMDLDAKRADIINEEYPKLAGVALGEVRDFHFEARDKYKLLAYLTLPPRSAVKNLPLVVLPHGGPEAQDSRGFDWLAQFLASRGYAVLQPQFRGSSGFGRAHGLAGRRQWGLRMQDDITDAVRAVIDQGIANPGQVCIVGWSYGGYAALAGAAFTPELYSCAASIAGVADLPTMLDYKQKHFSEESRSLAYWNDHIGSASDPQVIATSPARNVRAIRAPILLLHGTDDRIVPIAQSKAMARALEGAKKPFQLVELPGGDHSLNASSSRVKIATEIERFLAKSLSPPAPMQATD